MKIFKIIKSPLFIVLILIIPSFVALLKPGYYNMHDDMQMIRQLELEKCLKDGQIPCRWSPDPGYEYGYPLFNFYPPLPYIIGQLYRFLGFSFVWTVKLVAVTQFILAGLSIFFLVSSLANSKIAIISSLLYVYAPYRAVNIYIRAAMNEAWASVFFPLIFLFIKKVIDKPNCFNIIFLSLSIVGLMLSHNPMLLIFFLTCIPWTIYCLIVKFKKQKITNILKQIIIPLFISGSLAIGLAAFYTLPVIFESKLTQVDSMFQGYYSYEVHFVSLFQLFISNFWGDGPSVWGTEDGMPFMVGYLHWIVPVLYGLFLFFNILFKKKKLTNLDLLFLLFSVLGTYSLFMTHTRSVFLWKLLPAIQKIQFPWRFLNLSIFFLSVSAAISIVSFSNLIKSTKFSHSILILFVVLIFSLNFNYFHPKTSGPLTDSEKFSGKAWQNQITSGIYDYLPKTAAKGAISKANYVVDYVEPSTSAEIYGAKKGTDWLFFNANVYSNSKIIIAQLYFPNFIITNHGKPIDFTIDPEFGRMVLDLTPGNYQIYAKLNNTLIRSVSNYISLFSWSFLVFFLLYASKRHRHH